MTVFKVASDADDKLFIATPCCVQAIKNVWNDKTDPSRSEGFRSLWTVIAFFSLGLLAPALVTYREEVVRSGLRYSELDSLPDICHFSA